MLFYLMYNSIMSEKKRTVNQILVTQKIIVTPELKTKRRLYKFNFCLSCFLAVTLFSCCIYAEYDRNRSEEVSQDILLGIYDDKKDDDTTIAVEDDIIIVNALSDGVNESGEDHVVRIDNILSNQSEGKIVESIAPDGKSYYTEAILKIPSLGIEYPVLSNTSDELLKISLNKLWGPEPNKTRKLCNCWS